MTDFLRQRVIDLAHSASLEIIDPDICRASLSRLGQGRKLYVASLNKDRDPLRTTIPRAVSLKQRGFVVVPHIAVRNYRDAAHLESALSQLQANGIDQILLLAGDGKPAGAFHDTWPLLQDISQNNMLLKHGIRHIDFAGHPLGAHHATPERLLQAIRLKNRFVAMTGTNGGFVTQFTFNPAKTIDWAARINQQGNLLDVCAGIYGGSLALHKLWRNSRRSGFSIRQIARSLLSLAVDYALTLKWRSSACVLQSFLTYAQAPAALIPGLHIYNFGQLDRSVNILNALSNGDFTFAFTRCGPRLVLTTPAVS